MIELTVRGNVTAYRFAWSKGTNDFAPADRMTLWGGWRDEQPPPATTVQLGRLRCAGYNGDPELLEEARDVTVYALFVDGSEHVVARGRARLGDVAQLVPTLMRGDLASRSAVVAPWTYESRWEPRFSRLLALSVALSVTHK